MISNASTEGFGPILQVVITGGPCAGKDTAIPDIIESLGMAGYLALATPEVASMLINSNVTPWGIGCVEFHRQIALMQIQIESQYRRIAQEMLSRKPYSKIAHKPCVLLCNRGLLDIGAYFKPNYSRRLVRAILGQSDLTIGEALATYVGVVHLVTAADGAEEFYTIKNNSARKENDLELARSIDQKTITAWKEHPDCTVIRNVDRTGQKIGIERKKKLVIDQVLRIVRGAEGRMQAQSAA